MFVYYKELTIEEGFAVSRKSKYDRLVEGKQVSMAAGIELFSSLKTVQCWNCQCVADRWITCRGRNDHSRATLNLFASKILPETNKIPRRSILVMMTRDHIIPRSEGGADLIENLRPGCAICNQERGSKMTPDELFFMKCSPHLLKTQNLLHKK